MSMKKIFREVLCCQFSLWLFCQMERSVNDLYQEKTKSPFCLLRSKGSTAQRTLIQRMGSRQLGLQFVIFTNLNLNPDKSVINQVYRSFSSRHSDSSALYFLASCQIYLLLNQINPSNFFLCAVFFFSASVWQLPQEQVHSFCIFVDASYGKLYVIIYCFLMLLL